MVTKVTLYIFGYRLLVTDYRLQITDYRLQITDYRLQITDYWLKVTVYCLLVNELSLPFFTFYTFSTLSTFLYFHNSQLLFSALRSSPLSVVRCPLSVVRSLQNQKVYKVYKGIQGIHYIFLCLMFKEKIEN